MGLERSEVMLSEIAPLSARPLVGALVASIPERHLFIAMQQSVCTGDIRDSRGRADQRVHDPRVHVGADRHTHDEVVLPAVLRLVHLRIALALAVARRARGRDQRGIHHRAGLREQPSGRDWAEAFHAHKLRLSP